MQLKCCNFAHHGCKVEQCACVCVFASVRGVKDGNGNRIFLKQKTRFVRFRQCGFFATDGKFHPSCHLDNFFSSDIFFYYFIVIVMIVIYFLKGFRNLLTAAAVRVRTAQGFM